MSLTSKTKIVICGECGKEFFKTTNSKSCSKGCAAKARFISQKQLRSNKPKVILPSIFCKTCNIVFTPKSKTMVHCTRLCAIKYKQKLQKESSSKQKTNLKSNLSKYNLTIEQYDELVLKQHNRCAICNIHQVELIRRLSVDHDHTTGIIRGLLCHRCNLAIGLVDESVEILKAAINYLEYYKK